MPACNTFCSTGSINSKPHPQSPRIVWHFGCLLKIICFVFVFHTDTELRKFTNEHFSVILFVKHWYRNTCSKRCRKCGKAVTNEKYILFKGKLRKLMYFYMISSSTSATQYLGNLTCSFPHSFYQSLYLDRPSRVLF